MMSGIRKAPPISINSPRDTMTSCWGASAANVKSTAAALLLTTVAASQPVSSISSPSTWLSRSPRVLPARSNSRLLKPCMAATAAAIATGASTARPRLVCSTVPVRLNTGMSEGRACASRVAAQFLRHSDGSNSNAINLEASCALFIWFTRHFPKYFRSSPRVAARPCFWIRSCAPGRAINASTGGGRCDTSRSLGDAGRLRSVMKWLV